MEEAVHKLSEALRAYEEAHASYRTLLITNDAGTKEVTERTACDCPLCQQARSVLGE